MGESKENNLFELQFDLPNLSDGYDDILTEFLLSAGVDPQRIVISQNQDGDRLSVFFEEQNKAFAVKKELDALDFKNCPSRIKSLKKEDWQTLWKKDFKPFQLCDGFDVIPAWLKDEPSHSTRQPIFIDTSLAFGTGMHSTTQVMVGFIERSRGKFESFFDIGTGTGILAIVAFHCGAWEIDAVDISADAIEIAKENARENNCALIHFQAVDFSLALDQRKYDFIAANLITDDLIQLKEKIFDRMKSNAYLAVSGISVENLDRFRSAFETLAIKCLEVQKKEGWAGLLYQSA